MFICVCAVTTWDPIYFKTELDQSFTFVLNKNTDVVFRSVKNNVGGAYNSANGRFVAPISGIYLFIVSVIPECRARFPAEVNIMIDGVCAGYTISPTYCKSAGHCIAHLKAGQQVWLSAGPNKVSFQKGTSTYFSGVLLHPSN